jgi:hypothetical protein
MASSNAQVRKRIRIFTLWKDWAMEIVVNRTGGSLPADAKLGPVNTQTLSNTVAGQVRDIIAKMNFFELPAVITSHIGSDLFDYKTTVTDDGRTHTVNSNDLTPGPYRGQLAAVVKLLEDSGAAWKPIAGTEEKAAPIKYQLSGYSAPWGDGPFESIPTRYEIEYTPDRLRLTSEGGGGTHVGSIESYNSSELHITVVGDLGTFVTFTVYSFGDGTKLTGTLLIPRILLAAGTESAPVDALYIATYHAGHGDQPDDAELKHYNVGKLTGTATRDPA